MLTVTTGLTGRVWLGSTAGGNASGWRAPAFCDAYARSLDEIDTNSRPGRLLRDAAYGCRNVR